MSPRRGELQPADPAAVIREEFRRRLVRAGVLAVAAVGVAGLVLYGGGQVGAEAGTDLGQGQQEVTVGDGPVQANNLPGADPDTTTTTTAPPDTTQAPNEQPEGATDAEPAPKAPPAGAHDEPDQAAQTWFVHRLRGAGVSVSAEQVTAWPDRLTHDRFRVLVAAEAATPEGPKVPSAWLHVDRVGGSYWRVTEMLSVQGV